MRCRSICLGLGIIILSAKTDRRRRSAIYRPFSEAGYQSASTAIWYWQILQGCSGRRFVVWLYQGLLYGFWMTSGPSDRAAVLFCLGCPLAGVVVPWGPRSVAPVIGLATLGPGIAELMGQPRFKCEISLYATQVFSPAAYTYTPVASGSFKESFSCGSEHDPRVDTLST